MKSFRSFVIVLGLLFVFSFSAFAGSGDSMSVSEVRAMHEALYYKEVTVEGVVGRATIQTDDGVAVAKYELVDMEDATARITIRANIKRQLPQNGQNLRVTVLVKPGNRTSIYVEKSRTVVGQLSFVWWVAIGVAIFLFLIMIVVLVIQLVGRSKPAQPISMRMPSGGNSSNRQSVSRGKPSNPEFQNVTKDADDISGIQMTGDYYGKLVCEDGLLKGEELFLTRNKVKLNRFSFKKPDDTISRREHAVLFCEPGRISIQAAKGKMVRVNGAEIGMTPTPLESNDELQIGTNLFRLTIG